MEEMTVSRALSELKLTTDKIEKKIKSAAFVGCYQKRGKKVIGHTISKDDFEKNALTDYDSITGLIDRRDRIKLAVLVSNSKTKIKVAGNEYLVVEAIEKKKSIEHKRNLAAKLRADFTTVTMTIDQNTAKLNEDIRKMLTGTLDEERVKTEAEYQKIANVLREDNELSPVDILNAERKFQALQDEIDEFEANIDFALSESNALTKINF